MLNKDLINARLKKSLQGSTPKLKCLVTGLERITNLEYLKTKEEKFGSIKNYLDNYISREAIKLLKQNMPVVDIKNILNPSSEYIPSETLIAEARKYYDV
jgi:hypothetical protein